SQPNTMIQESVRAFYTGWYKELVTELPKVVDGHVLPMEGPGLGTELLPAIFDRPDLTSRNSELSDMNRTNPFDLTRRTALVTGSSRGLGLAIAKGLGDAGARLVINGVNIERLDETASSLRGEGYDVDVVGFDVTDEASVTRTFADLDKKGIAV